MKNKKYKEYNEIVQRWMASLESDLERELGEVPSSYQVQLDLIADAFETYVESKRILKKEGLLINSRGGLVKNPIFSLINSSQLFIAKLLGQLALTRMAKSKLKQVDDYEPSPIDEFV